MNGNDGLLTILLALMALLYSSVGHAGSSGYQAAMGLFDVAPEMMKPIALFLNIVVASIGTWQFARRDSVDWQRLLWLVVGSIPAAYVGGFLTLKPGWYYVVVGIVLWIAAVRLWFVALPGFKQQTSGLESPRPRLDYRLLLLVGIGLGFLSGLTGTGGGIFLTPLLVLCGWSTPRQAAGLSVAFILANSPAGLIGWWQKTGGMVHLPSLLPWWMVLVGVFGWLGSWFGSKYGSPLVLRRLLALVLVIAGAKMVLQGLK
jgi:uncharacterized protein